MSDRGLKNYEERVRLFIARVRERVHRYLYGPGRPAFLAPLGVFLTFTMFAINMTWTILTIPLSISISIYEEHVRAIFPWLPSIRQNLLTLRTIVLRFLPKESGAAHSAAGQSTNAPLPKLDVDLDAIRAGGS